MVTEDMWCTSFLLAILRTFILRPFYLTNETIECQNVELNVWTHVTVFVCFFETHCPWLLPLFAFAALGSVCVCFFVGGWGVGFHMTLSSICHNVILSEAGLLLITNLILSSLARMIPTIVAFKDIFQLPFRRLRVRLRRSKQMTLT